MRPDLLLHHFDCLAKAPDALPRLRRFILDLAVRGKLVEQDPRDEPASELLKRIQAEKLRLMKVNDVTKEKPIPSLAADDLPFLMPRNWCWTQLAKVGFINPRNTAPDELPASFVPMTLISAEYGVVNKHEVRPWTEIKSGYTHFAEGDVGLAKITPCFENRKSTVFRELTGGIGAGTTELHIVRPILTDVDFLLIFLKSPHFIETGIPKMTGTAGQKRVPTEYFAYSPFPLPPLAEQQRIVTRADELMALCDRLEAAQAERGNRRDRLVASSLNRLNNGADPDAFRDHARFYFNHLPRLTTRTEHIQQLRQTILSLAVRGKLVPQDPKDEPAPVFAIEKRDEEEDRIRLRLPLGWSWARVENVAEARLGKMLDKAKNSGKAYRYLRNTNIHWFKVRMDELKDLRIEANEVEKYVLRNGDVLICEGGHGIGRTAVWRSMETDIIFQKALHRVRPSQALNSEFFAYCVSVYFHAGVLQSYFTGVGIPHFTGVALSKLVFPLPPIKEQDRIVAKVDELMALCDRLETQLSTTHAESRRLLEAVLHEALVPAV